PTDFTHTRENDNGSQPARTCGHRFDRPVHARRPADVAQGLSHEGHGVLQLGLPGADERRQCPARDVRVQPAARTHLGTTYLLAGHDGDHARLVPAVRVETSPRDTGTAGAIHGRLNNECPGRLTPGTRTPGSSRRAHVATSPAASPLNG